MTSFFRARIVIAAVGALLSACIQASHSPASNAMSESTSTTTATEAQSTTYCLGRFLIDVPKGSTLGGSIYKYNFARLEEPKPLSFKQFRDEVGAIEAELRKSPHEEEPSLLRASRSPDDSSKIFAFWKKEYSAYVVDIEGYKWVDGQRFLFKSEASVDRQDQAIDRMVERLAHLRPRPNDHIPSDPGYCFDGGFVANEEWENEQVRVEIDIAGHPDAYLTVWFFPLASEKRDKPLLERVSGVVQGLGRLATGVHVLRQGQRQLASYKGQEHLSSVPNSGAFRGHYFIWETQGEGTLEEPRMSIELSTGEPDKRGNPLQTQLTDAQAIALWDRIVSSFRLRPTGRTPAATSMATPPEIPIGTLAATGRICPRTGWWQCAETGPVQGGTRQYFQAGEPMPMVALQARPSLWQRLRGRTPTHRLATVWTLKEGEAPASHADSVATGPGSPASPHADSRTNVA